MENRKTESFYSLQNIGLNLQNLMFKYEKRFFKKERNEIFALIDLILQYTTNKILIE